MMCYIYKGIWRAALLCTLFGVCLTSCLGDDDNDTFKLTSDCCITNVTLGNMRRLVTLTASDGSDSTARQSYTASGFAFRIDQLKNVIYNPEFLPHNVQLDAALLNISANGAVAWRKRSNDPQEEINNDEWKAYSSSDSIDVRDTIMLRVYSYDGKQQRDYKLKVNRYDRDPDSLYWKRVASCEPLGKFVMHRSFVRDGELCVVGRDEEGRVGLVRPLAEAPAMEEYEGEYDPSATGIDEIDRLVAKVDADREYLPTLYVAGAAITSGDGGTRYVLAGMREAESNDTCAVVWMGVPGRLFYCTPNNENEYALPALKYLQLLSYKGRLAAIGGEQLYGSTRTALAAVYVSKNYGLTWSPRTKWAIPAGLRGRTQPMSATCDGEKIYVVSGEEVWEGR